MEQLDALFSFFDPRGRGALSRDDIAALLGSHLLPALPSTSPSSEVQQLQVPVSDVATGTLAPLRTPYSELEFLATKVCNVEVCIYLGASSVGK